MHQTVAIQSSSYQVTDFSEFYLTKLPVFRFNINASTIGEPFTGFCIDLICETVKNLVVARQLEISYIFRPKSFWNRIEKPDWYLKSTTTDLNAYSWLEQQILSAALTTGKRSLKVFITGIIKNHNETSKLLPRYILYQVAANSQTIINTCIKKRFLSKQLSITINENISLEHFIKTEGQLGLEYVANKEFKDFSNTLFIQLREAVIESQNE